MKLSVFAMMLLMSCAASKSSPEGPWKIAVTSSGGLAGKGAGSYSVQSDGRIDVTNMNGRSCTFEATAEELARFAGLVRAAQPEQWKISYAPEERCCDRIEYDLTLDRGGSVREVEWIDDPLPMPGDLAAIVDATMGGPQSLRVVYGGKCR